MNTTQRVPGYSLLATNRSATVIVSGISSTYCFFPLTLEAEYTYQLHKDVIPLMMDYKYKPDGWLGIIVGAKFWIDFTERHKLDSNIHVLVRELGIRGKVEAQETQTGNIQNSAFTVAVTGYLTICCCCISRFNVW